MLKKCCWKTNGVERDGVRLSGSGEGIYTFGNGSVKMRWWSCYYCYNKIHEDSV